MIRACRRLFLAIAQSAALVSSVVAQTYGTADGGCERAAGNPINDTDAYFDGTHFAGQGWICELTPAAGHAYVGLCADEGDPSPMRVTFMITIEGDTVTIAADDQVLTLKRCE